MKLMTILFSLFLTMKVYAAVPTEEGLLKNLNNADVPGNLITIKAMTSTEGAIAEVATPSSAGTAPEAVKSDFYKFVISSVFS